MDEITTIVRTYDLDRYLAALLAPEKARPHLMALYAFNAEICRITGQVSEPQLAEIRLQWWLDTLDAIYFGDPQAHPVAKALSEAIKVGDIPKFALQRLAKAHSQDFYSDGPQGLHDLEAYLGETESSLIKMAAMILHQDAALECNEAAGLGGVAYGLMRLFNRLPQAKALKQNLFPQDMLLLRQIPLGAFYDAEHEAGAMVILADLRQLAQKRLSEARDKAWTVKPEINPAFLHVTLTDAYLVKAFGKGALVRAQGCDFSQMRKQWRLWRASQGQTY